MMVLHNFHKDKQKWPDSLQKFHGLQVVANAG
jgi:hypothetical protein